LSVGCGSSSSDEAASTSSSGNTRNMSLPAGARLTVAGSSYSATRGSSKAVTADENVALPYRRARAYALAVQARRFQRAARAAICGSRAAWCRRGW
jgi:hypothetical protein